MARSLPTALVIVLLAGTATAFAVTERLKLEPSPLAVAAIRPAFSPVCDCPSARVSISLRLREADRVVVDVLDADGEVVRTLLDERVAAGRFVAEWDGRDAEGSLVPEGVYRPRVRLGDDDRTFVLQNRIRVDVTRPRVRLVSARPRVLSPDGDFRRERLVVTYRLGERAAPALLVDGRREVLANLRRRGVGHLDWRGRIGDRRAPAGRYRVALVATDVAGNRSVPAAVTVRVRYVELARRRYRVRPRARFRVSVSTDARRIRWRLGARSGVFRRRAFRLRAPRRPGRYTLVVEARGHSDRAQVVVRRAE